jgi:demethylspheroidene O-methyltransferase
VGRRVTPVASPPSLADRWLGARDRLLASPRFQRWAAAFPVTRPIAQRRARALFDLCAGFVYSQILAACVRLRLCEILYEGPQPLDALAGRLALGTDAAARLLDAAVALRLAARRRDGRYALGDLGAALVGNPGIAAMVEHHALLYADLRDPVALLRGTAGDTELARYWPYAGAGEPAELTPDRVAAYTGLMAASQPLVAGDVLDAYPLGRHQCLLDVGGGDGTFLVAAAERAPQLRLVLFDLPAVARRARARFAAAGLADRTRVVGGDFHSDPLPVGADVASLVRVLHDHDDAGAAAILRAVREALPPGGVLLVAEPMSGTPGAETVGDAYFAFYLLAMGRGRPRTPAENRALLHRAGFERVREVATARPLQTRLLVASVNPA